MASGCGSRCCCDLHQLRLRLLPRRCGAGWLRAHHVIVSPLPPQHLLPRYLFPVLISEPVLSDPAWGGVNKPEVHLSDRSRCSSAPKNVQISTSRLKCDSPGMLSAVVHPSAPALATPPKTPAPPGRAQQCRMGPAAVRAAASKGPWHDSVRPSVRPAHQPGARKKGRAAGSCRAVFIKLLLITVVTAHPRDPALGYATCERAPRNSPYLFIYGRAARDGSDKHKGNGEIRRLWLQTTRVSSAAPSPPSRAPSAPLSSQIPNPSSARLR